MKKFLLSIVLPILVISCSTESDFNPSENNNASEAALINNSEIPENKANPFDEQGRKYYEVLGAYLKENGAPHSTSEVIKQVQFISSEYDRTGDTKKVSIAVVPEQVSWIMTDPENSLTKIIAISSLGTEAKLSLMNFLKSLIEKKGYEYSALYDFIVSYEAAVQGSTALDENEKETILSVSSVSRYSLYADSGHIDRDWEISVGNRKAGKAFDSHSASIAAVLALFEKLF